MTDASPFSVLSANRTKHVHVALMGWEDGCLDALAYESLFSITLLNNYLRLVSSAPCSTFSRVELYVSFSENKAVHWPNIWTRELLFPFEVEQYKNVVFYGPTGASKTFLAKKLAKCVQVRASFGNTNRAPSLCEVPLG